MKRDEMRADRTVYKENAGKEESAGEVAEF